MAVQNSSDNTTRELLLSGVTLSREAETILQDAARVADLLKNTLMAQITATKKWVPLTDIALVTGASIARGIYVGEDIAAADLVAGDVVDAPIIVGGAAATFASDLLVIENALTLDTIVQVGAVDVHRVGDDLARIGLYSEAIVNIDEFEN